MASFTLRVLVAPRLAAYFKAGELHLVTPPGKDLRFDLEQSSDLRAWTTLRQNVGGGAEHIIPVAGLQATPAGYFRLIVK